MGVKQLFKFLRDTCPDVFEDVHISEYAFKKVAIDISLYLFVYKASQGNDWIKSFIKLIECLRQNELHCVFIYDTSSPPEKEAEKKDRRDQREKLEQRIYKLEEALERYHETNEIDPLLIEFQDKRKIKPKRLLRDDRQLVDIRSIQYHVDKMKKNLFTVTEKDFDLTKELFDILDVPYFQAPMEAETCCSDLCKRGLVDAVLSRDSDVLAYGAPVFLTNLNTDTGVCQRIHYNDMLEQLELTDEQFLDFCIMCGTDYNKNIFRIGPKKAYDLIRSHSTIDIIEEKTKHDTSILNHRRGRELFRDYEQAEFNIPYCGAPDFEKLLIFLRKRNIHVPIEKLKKAFLHNTIVFEDDDEDIEIEVECTKN